jgi:hypothetical protein
MRRNRPHAFVNQILACSLVAICLSGSIGLGTVWMRHQISIAANANRLLEARIADVERRAEEVSAATAAERDPAALGRRNTEWHLGLVAPEETRTQRITEDPLRHLAANHNPFGDGSTAVTFRLALGQ